MDSIYVSLSLVFSWLLPLNVGFQTHPSLAPRSCPQAQGWIPTRAPNPTPPSFRIYIRFTFQRFNSPRFNIPGFSFPAPSKTNRFEAKRNTVAHRYTLSSVHRCGCLVNVFLPKSILGLLRHGKW